MNDVQDLELEETTCRSLIERVRDDPTFKCFETDYVWPRGLMSPDDERFFAEVMRTNTTLEQISLFIHCTMSCTGIASLCRALAQNERTSLNILTFEFHVSIASLPAAAMAELLRVNTSITYLEFKCSVFESVDGLVSIAHAIQMNENTALRSLVIVGIYISDEAAIALAELLKHNTSIEVCLLTNKNYRSQSLSPLGARAIAEAVRDNKTLLRLHLRMLNESENGYHALADMLRHNTTLTELMLLTRGKNDDFIFNGALMIAQALEHNNETALQKLILSLPEENAQRRLDVVTAFIKTLHCNFVLQTTSFTLNYGVRPAIEHTMEGLLARNRLLHEFNKFWDPYLRSSTLSKSLPAALWPLILEKASRTRFDTSSACMPYLILRRFALADIVADKAKAP